MRLRYRMGGGGGAAIVLRLPGEEEGMRIEDVHMCRLGMKFLCGTPLPEFMEYAFGLGLEGAGGEDPVEFHGVVVQSEPEEERGWRVAIHFCGVGEADAERIDRYSAMAHLRCEACGGGREW